MGEKKRVPGRPFKKGWKGGPGRPKLEPVVREAMKMNREEFVKIADKCLNMTHEDLQKAWENPKTPAKEMLLVSILVHAIRTGDHHRYDFILNRMCGRVPITAALWTPPAGSDPASPGGPKPQVILTLPSNGKEADIEDAVIVDDEA